MLRRSAGVAALVVAAVQESLTPAAALPGGPAAGWATLFGGLGLAAWLGYRGGRRAWTAAGLAALVLADLAVLVHSSGLPGRRALPWDAASAGALAAALLVVVLWTAGSLRGAVLRVAAGGVAVAVLLPLGAGAPLPAAVPTVAAAGHVHPGPPPPSAAPAAVPADLDAQLAEARAAALRWPTAADAQADGWIKEDNYTPGTGSHWMRYDEIDSVFDPAVPEMLLYGGDDPGSPIVGVTYYVVHHQPAGFAGDADVWHQHQDVCIGRDGPLFAGDGPGHCRAPWKWSWMLHVWVVPGHEDPDGVFAMENPLV
jgi:hypothetical protein